MILVANDAKMMKLSNNVEMFRSRHIVYHCKPPMPLGYRTSVHRGYNIQTDVGNRIEGLLEKDR